jgi:hypothetical protein
MINPFQSTVSKQIVEDFLTNLSEAHVEKDVRDRLQSTIFDQGKLSEVALRTALFDTSEDD